MPKDIEVGRIELAYGPMFSHKTEWLITRLDGYQRAGYSVAAFRPKKDTRYSRLMIHSHSGQEWPATRICCAEDILRFLAKQRGVQIVGIEEAQFLDDHVIEVLEELRNQHKIVVANGLLTAFNGELFPLSEGNGTKTMGDLVAIGDSVRAHTAICQYRENGSECGREDASRTQRLFLNWRPVPYDDPLIIVGGNKSTHGKHPRRYQARCPQHHFVSVGKEILPMYEFKKRQPTPQC